jgi:RNA polymerase sigma-70 factor (ECF subfamily)
MSNPEQSDEELMRLYRETKDKSIVIVLFNRIEHHLAAKAMVITKNKEDTEDILADVLMELFNDLLKGEIKNFGGYVYVKTRNRCLTFVKRKGKQESLDQDEQKNNEDLVEFQDLSGLDKKPIENAKQILADCIGKLPEKERTCLNLFYFYEQGNGKFGMRYQEISKHTGFTNREVTTALQRGRRLVKTCLEDDGIDGKGLFDED